MSEPDRKQSDDRIGDQSQMRGHHIQRGISDPDHPPILKLVPPHPRLDEEQVNSDTGKNNEEHHHRNCGTHIGIAQLGLMAKKCAEQECTHNFG